MNWKPIADCPGYEVSDAGMVRSLKRPSGMKFKRTRKIDPYFYVTLVQADGRKRHALVSRLVLEAFVGPAPSERHQAAHGDGVKANNSLLNLRWATQVENEADKNLHGTRPKGEGHPLSCGLTDKQVEEIRAQIPWPHGHGRVLAKQYGVSEYVICTIKSGKRRAA